MEEKTLWQEICAASQLEGRFELRSGQIATTYFDKYRFESHPQLLAKVADGMAPLVPAGTEVIAGLELGGVPLAVAISLKTGSDVAFVRKQAKKYGTCRLAEGAEIAGKNVCIIEDVITTGGQVIQSALELRKLGAHVQHVVCAIWRGPEARELLRREGLELLSLFSPALEG